MEQKKTIIQCKNSDIMESVIASIHSCNRMISAWNDEYGENNKIYYYTSNKETMRVTIYTSKEDAMIGNLMLAGCFTPDEIWTI